MASADSLRPAPLIPSRNPTRVTTKPEPDIEANSPPPSPHCRSAFIPGFIDPPPFLTFLRHSWFDIATQLLCLLIAYLVYTFCPPIMPRYFPLYPGVEKSDWGIKHSQPYMKEYVDTNVSAALGFCGPALVMGAIALWGTRRFEDGNAALVGLGYALSTATLFQILIKIFIGGLRPHFLSICKPRLPPSLRMSSFPGSQVGFYTAKQVCTGDEDKIKEAQMSFPSGHACAAFAGFGFLALFLNAKYKIFSRGGHFRQHYGTRAEREAEHEHVGDSTQRVRHWKLVLFVAPWCIAVVLALSKMRDGWHHPVDLVFGSLLGTFFAHMAYKMVYRSVYDEETNHIPCGRAGAETVEEGVKVA
ncbi:phosphatidic acid phosphatase type 2/haloperoxidase [Phaeosphaeria sp. MPI-PUGE-AT-0046c]|nr:phosphatidic acid phosphatase type 2/haloperoxidase [Phaeosphaeria sp. MPI-PUGE-AT-0046c]